MSNIDRSATTLRVRADASNAEREIQKFTEALGRNTARIKQFQATAAKGPQLNLSKTNRELNRFSNTARNSFGALAAYNTFTASLSGVLSGAFVFALANAATNLFKLGAEAESTRERFLALSESIGIGRARYEELFDFASNRGLEFKGLAEATNQLRVVGFAGTDLDEIIREVGIIAGSSTEKVQRITRALGQMRAFGRVALEELNQLTEAGVPIIQALAKQLEVAEGRVRGLISLGKIDFSDVRAAITDLAAEGSAFFIASEAQAATTQAEINRLKNAYFLLADELNDRTAPAFKGIIAGGTSIIEFLTTMEGAWISMSGVVLAAAIPAFGAILLHINRLSGVAPTAAVPRLARNLSNVNLRLQQVSATSAGVTKGFRSIAVAARAAFTGPAAIITGLAVVAIPLLIEQMELARERAEVLAEAVTGPLPEIQESDDPRAFSRRERLSEREQRGLKSRLQTVNNINAVIATTLRRQEKLGERGDILNDELENYRENLRLANNAWREQYNIVNNIRTSLGTTRDEVVQPSVPEFISDRVDPEEELAPWRIFLSTLELEYSLTQIRLSKLQRAGAITRLENLRESERALEKLLEELALFEDVSSPFGTGGFFFDDAGRFQEFGAVTITRTREQLAALRLEIAAIQAQQKETNIDPLADVDKILASSAQSIAELNADISVGAVEIGERQEELLSINRDTLSDLLVLLQEFRSEADPEIYGEAIDRITSRLAGFRESIRQASAEDFDLTELFVPGASTFDPVAALDGLFSDAEREYVRRVKGFITTIGNVRQFTSPVDSPLDILGVPFEDDLPEFDSNVIGKALLQQRQAVDDASNLLSSSVLDYNQIIIDITDPDIREFDSNSFSAILDQQRQAVDDANSTLSIAVIKHNQSIGGIIDPNLLAFDSTVIGGVLQEQGQAVDDANDFLASAIQEYNQTIGGITDPDIMLDNEFSRVLQQQRQVIDDAKESLAITVLEYNQTIGSLTDPDIVDLGDSSIGSALQQQRRVVEDANDFFRPISFEYNKTIGDIINPDLREFGASLGIHILDQNEIIAGALADRNDLSETESLRFLEFLDTQVEAVRETSERAEDLPTNLSDIFDVQLPPQARAFANAILTTGEAAVSAGPALDALFSIFESGSNAFDDPAAGVIGFFNALATGVSLVEQPLLAFSDAAISSSEAYINALENIVSLSPEEQDIFFESLPDFYEERLRLIVEDFQEVYARVGDEFDANVFRLLPQTAQDNLEAAYQIFRGARPTLERVFGELNEVIEAENITVAERIRRTGQFVADNLVTVAIEYGDTVTSIVNALTALTSAGGDAVGLGREVVGNLGTFFGLERDRVNTFFDAVVNGTESVILTERITQSLDATSIGVALNFLRLDRAVSDVDGSIQSLTADAFRMNAAFEGAEFRGSDLVGTLENVNDALGVTQLTIEDVGVSAAGLALSGGNIAGLIAPGANLLAGALNDVVDSAANYITAVRLSNQIPAFIRDADVETLQRYGTELITFEQRFNDVLQLRRELDNLGAGITIPFPQLSEGAREFQQALGAVSPSIAGFRSELGEAFLAFRGFSPDEAGGSIVESLIGSGQFKVLADEYAAFQEAIFQGNIQIANSFLTTFGMLGDLIANQASNAIKILEFELTELREIRQEAEMEVNEQLNRELEGLREQLDAGLLSLLDYYSAVDEARDVAKQDIEDLRAAEIKKENDIQNKRYEAEVNAFNIRKVTAIANIIIGAAQAVATTFATLGPLAFAVAPAVAAAALAGTVLVAGQSPPPRPPDITLQEGGVVTGPTNALIGEAGPEAVIPLDEYTFNKRGEGNVTVVVNVNGSVIEERRLAESVYKATREAQRVRRVPR